MIRFLADSWLEALLRPFIMGLPLGGIYVETIAPDFRFIFALLLAVAWLVVLVRTRRSAPMPTVVLLAFCAASFVPWLVTSGNGRYFMATLLLVGPLAVVLLHQMPLTRGGRLAGAALMLATQGFLAYDVVPWHSWGLVEWRDPPPFAVDVPQDVARRPATFVTMTSISYSLLAPSFHPESHWISLASQQGRRVSPRDTRQVQQLLTKASTIYVLFPSPPGQVITSTRIPEPLAESLDAALTPHGLRMPADRQCRLMPSRGLTSLGLQPGAPVPTAPEEQRGFWLCPADRVAPVPAPAIASTNPRVEAMFDRLEQMCPRMFKPGTAISVALPGGIRRHYSDSDMRLFVTQDGEVLYKYIRSMNAVSIGSVDQVLDPSFKLDCKNIHGRSGMPWDREI